MHCIDVRVGPSRSLACLALACLCVGVLALAPSVARADSGIRGTVVSDEGAPLAYASIQILGTNRGAMAGSNSKFVLSNLAAGTYQIRVSYVGHETITREVTVADGLFTEVTFTLAVRPFEMPGISVTALRPDLSPDLHIRENMVRERNPRDAGELMRGVPGVDAVRRGALGLDPVVRGLRETQVGVYLDGTRLFAACPGRMDSPLTHCEPATLDEVQIVTGPYALTWGAGNMSAIRAESRPLPASGTGKVHARVGAGYDTNVEATEANASVFGNLQKFSYQLNGAWREGNNYLSGDSTVVSAGFTSQSVLGKVDFLQSGVSKFSLASGYQKQENVDYPGRMMDAKYFDTFHLKAGWDYQRAPSGGGQLRSFNTEAYVNDVDHEMNNDNKPTAQPNPNRMPPWPIDATTTTQSTVWGGRAAAVWDAGGSFELETGADFYASNRDGRRVIKRRDTEMFVREDIVWPNAWIADAGLFLRAKKGTSKFSTAATVRLDYVRAKPDSLGDFYLNNVEGDLEAEEYNVSGAVSASVPLALNWTVSLGVGSVVRTADATERYSDRFSSTKAQISAEFMGNPGLRPERSTQADLWIRTDYRWIAGSLNGYVRRIDDYITIEPTELPPRMPSNQFPVYRYVNGEAIFYGVDGQFDVSATRYTTIGVSGSYIWAEDTSRDEPVMAIPPLQLGARVRLHPAGRETYYTEAAVKWAGRQDRVAASRGEIATDGYTVLDLRAGLFPVAGVEVRGGVFNATNENYINHLNVRNPFTGLQIPEPGRVFFVEAAYSL
jgi:iron complex outermembrane receptor protein